MSEIPACPRCKRREGDGCDTWCDGVADVIDTPGPAPVIVRQGAPSWDYPDPLPKPSGPVALANLQPDELRERGRRGAESRRRDSAAKREEIEMSQVSTTAAKACKRCTRADVEFARGGADPYCKGCRRDLMQGGRKPPAVFAGDKSVNGLAETVNIAPADQVDEIPHTATQTGPLAVETQSAPAAAADDCPDVSAQDRTDAGDGWVADHRFDPSPTSRPNGPRTVADLQAERARVSAYLAQLDEEIATAEAIELLGDRSPAELQVLLEEAQRMAHLCQLAIARRVA